MRNALCIFGTVFIMLVFAAIPVFANGTSGDEDWHMGEGWHHMMDFQGGDFYMWLLLLIVIGVAIYLFMNRSPNQQFFSKQEETPLEILKRRYANGEITKEEYEQMKQDVV